MGVKREMRNFLSKVLEPSLPVSRTTCARVQWPRLGRGFSFAVNNRERKALKDEFPGFVQTLGPTLRRRGY